jgi:hypothetical protein
LNSLKNPDIGSSATQGSHVGGLWRAGHKPATPERGVRIGRKVLFSCEPPCGGIVQAGLVSAAPWRSS